MRAQRFDLVSREFKQDPMPTFAKLREAGPLVRSRIPLLGEVWLAVTYESVNRILRDHETFVQEPGHAGRPQLPGLLWWMPRSFMALAKNMIGRDEPDHRRLRSLVDDAFLRQSVDGARPRIQALADQFLDDWVRAAARDGGRADLIRYFARPFPLAVICEILGLPDDDRPRFTRWANRFTTTSSALGLIAGLFGVKKLQDYLKREFQNCRERPRPGLISALVAVEQAGDRLDEDELLSMVFLLLLAGHETTVHLIAGGVLALLDHPDQKAKLTADWSRVGSAVDEVLRYVSPVQLTKPRFASRDLDLYGRSIRRGDVLMPLIAAANCDPEHFEKPDQFEIDRHPNPHLGFGTGIHVCLGMKLARTEAEIAFERIFTRFPDLALAVPASELAWTKRLGMRSMTCLPVTSIGNGTLAGSRRISTGRIHTTKSELV